MTIKDNLKRMVLSPEWKQWIRSLSGSQRTEGEEISEAIDDSAALWPKAEAACDIMAPAFAMMKVLESESQTVAEVYAAAAEVGYVV